MTRTFVVQYKQIPLLEQLENPQKITKEGVKFKFTNKVVTIEHLEIRKLKGKRKSLSLKKYHPCDKIKS